ncbi:hypothetical protein ACBP46_04660 [Paenalcaligenes hominis]|uniref:hypothetical protein n=1 Tax=Paenalcaligenes hominis TaxID=643674 RepID=UPI00352487A5
MSLPFNNFAQFKAAVSDALIRAAQLAREDAIKTNTGIVIKKNGKIVEISAAELKQQALAVKKHHLAEQDNKQ